MNADELIQWIFVNNRGNRHLYRSTFFRKNGTLELPDFEKIQFHVRSGNKFHWKTNRKSLFVRSFEEGEVAYRTSNGNIKVCGKNVWAKALWATAGLPIFGFTLFHIVLGRTQSVSTLTVKPIVTSSPVVPSPPVHVAPMSVIHRVAKKKTEPPQKWEAIGRKVRAKLITGKLDEASTLISVEVDQKKGNIPEAILKLSSEVHYAICKRFYDQKKWQMAKSMCERAQEYISHNRAKIILKTLSDRARKNFYEAYVLESFDLNAALARYRDVLKIAPSNDIYASKAQEKIKRIQTVLNVE